MIVFLIVFLNTLISYTLIIYIRYNLIKRFLRSKFVKYVVELYFNKYKKWNVYAG